MSQLLQEVKENVLQISQDNLEELWDEYARAGYENAYRIHAFSDIRKKMGEFFLNSNNGIFLDAGCGAGGMFNEIAQKICPKELWGIDWSEEMLKRAQREIERLQDQSGAFPKYKLYQIDLSEPLLWPDNTFDGVISQVVICYLPYGWKEPVKELSRVIRPGGYLYLSTFLKEWEFSSAMRIFRLATRELLCSPTGTLYGIKFRSIAARISEKAKKEGAEFPSRDELMSFLKTVGFEEIDATPVLWGFGLVLRAKKPL